jgi:hypothetical protein
MFRNLIGQSENRRRPRRHVPEVSRLEGRVVLSAFHPHAAVPHHAAVHATRVHRAAHPARTGLNTMQVTVLGSHAASTTTTANPTPLAPGEFGPNSPYPFAGYRPGGFYLHAFTPSTSAPASTATVTNATGASSTSTDGTATLTPLAPGEFGPNSPYPFAGYRPGGYFLH